MRYCTVALLLVVAGCADWPVREIEVRAVDFRDQLRNFQKGETLSGEATVWRSYAAETPPYIVPMNRQGDENKFVKIYFRQEDTPRLQKLSPGDRFKFRGQVAQKDSVLCIQECRLRE
jgi:hypothetical protein